MKQPYPGRTLFICVYPLPTPNHSVWACGCSIKIVVVVESCGIEPVEWDKRGLRRWNLSPVQSKADHNLLIRSLIFRQYCIECMVLSLLYMMQDFSAWIRCWSCSATWNLKPHPFSLSEEVVRKVCEWIAREKGLNLARGILAGQKFCRFGCLGKWQVISPPWIYMWYHIIKPQTLMLVGC